MLVPKGVHYRGVPLYNRERTSSDVESYLQGTCKLRYHARTEICEYRLYPKYKKAQLIHMEFREQTEHVRGHCSASKPSPTDQAYYR